MYASIPNPISPIKPLPVPSAKEISIIRAYEAQDEQHQGSAGPENSHRSQAPCTKSALACTSALAQFESLSEWDTDRPMRELVPTLRIFFAAHSSPEF